MIAARNAGRGRLAARAVWLWARPPGLAIHPSALFRGAATCGEPSVRVDGWVVTGRDSPVSPDGRVG